MTELKRIEALTDRLAAALASRSMPEAERAQLLPALRGLLTMERNARERQAS